MFANELNFLVLVLLVANFLFSAVLLFMYYQSVRHYRNLTRGLSKRQDLSKILEHQLDRLEVLSSKMQVLEEDNRAIKKSCRHHLQKFGLVRFNPFGDTGGDQSFAAAFLTGQGDGVVISSLHGRATSRVFGKPIKNGKQSGYQFSQEEQHAVDLALNSSL